MEKLNGLGHLFVTIFIHIFSTFMVMPGILDVTMAALCPGQYECSIAIYLTGIQQALIGLGSLIMMPIVGNLSDKHGRKSSLTIPMVLIVIPTGILAYSRTTTCFYAYFVLKTLTSMVCESSIHCISLAYVADNVPEGKRATAFGIMAGIGSCGFLCGTISARFLSTSSTFQVSALLAVVALLYMKFFLPESVKDVSLKVPILSKEAMSVSVPLKESIKKEDMSNSLPLSGDMIPLLRTSPTFLKAAIVAFFSNLSDAGFHASMLYFYKAKFHYNKDQFADLMLIMGVAGTFSQLLLMPLLAPIFGEERLLSLGLVLNFVQISINGIAWAAWVPYGAALLTIFSVFTQPCMRTIVSKQVGSDEQGKAQGCISGICSLANVISPLAMSPLTALFLSDRAPFDFPGFSLMCIAFSSMIAFIPSIMISTARPISDPRHNNCNHTEP